VDKLEARREVRPHVGAGRVLVFIVMIIEPTIPAYCERGISGLDFCFWLFFAGGKKTSANTGMRVELWCI